MVVKQPTRRDAHIPWAEGVGVCVWKLRLQTPALASFEAGKGAGEVVEENVHYVGTLALHCSS